MSNNKGLQFLDKHIIGAIIVDAWQNQLNTEMDPASGQWFTNGPDNNGGLYGHLTDKLATKLVFLPSERVFTSHKIAAATSTADNRNGKLPETTFRLAYNCQQTTTTTHSTTNALMASVSVAIEAKAEVLGTGGGVTTTIDTQYSFSWTKEESASKTQGKEVSQEVPLKIPKGKVYYGMLLADNVELNAPYYADIYLRGQSTANFASPVNGKKIWTIDAGSLCDWINKYKSAGDESEKYMRDPNDPTQGLIRLRGNLTAEDTVNFVAMVLDITNTYSPTDLNNMSGKDLAALGEKAIISLPVKDTNTSLNRA
jgi:hypothetical protein